MLDDAIVRLLADDDLYHAAIDIAFASRHALQDCLYLAAAEANRARLMTADRKLFERGGKSVGGVILLDDV